MHSNAIQKEQIQTVSQKKSTRFHTEPEKSTFDGVVANGETILGFSQANQLTVLLNT